MPVISLRTTKAADMAESGPASAAARRGASRRKPSGDTIEVKQRFAAVSISDSDEGIGARTARRRSNNRRASIVEQSNRASGKKGKVSAYAQPPDHVESDDAVEEYVFSSEEDLEEEDKDDFDDVRSVITLSSESSTASEERISERPWKDFDIAARREWELMYCNVTMHPVSGDWSATEEYQREKDSEMLRYMDDFPLDQWVLPQEEAKQAYFRLLERTRWRSLGISIYGPDRAPGWIPGNASSSRPQQAPDTVYANQPRDNILSTTNPGGLSTQTGLSEAAEHGRANQMSDGSGPPHSERPASGSRRQHHDVQAHTIPQQQVQHVYPPFSQHSHGPTLPIPAPQQHSHHIMNNFPPGPPHPGYPASFQGAHRSYGPPFHGAPPGPHGSPPTFVPQHLPPPPHALPSQPYAQPIPVPPGAVQPSQAGPPQPVYPPPGYPASSYPPPPYPRPSYQPHTLPGQGTFAAPAAPKPRRGRDKKESPPPLTPPPPPPTPPYEMRQKPVDKKGNKAGRRSARRQAEAEEFPWTRKINFREAKEQASWNDKVYDPETLDILERTRARNVPVIDELDAKVQEQQRLARAAKKNKGKTGENGESSDAEASKPGEKKKMQRGQRKIDSHGDPYHSGAFAFASHEDEQRAAELGFKTPDEALEAGEAGKLETAVQSTIRIYWNPGKKGLTENLEQIKFTLQDTLVTRQQLRSTPILTRRAAERIVDFCPDMLWRGMLLRICSEAGYGNKDVRDRFCYNGCYCDKATITKRISAALGQKQVQPKSKGYGPGEWEWYDQNVKDFAQYIDFFGKRTSHRNMLKIQMQGEKRKMKEREAAGQLAGTEGEADAGDAGDADGVDERNKRSKEGRAATDADDGNESDGSQDSNVVSAQDSDILDKMED